MTVPSLDCFSEMASIDEKIEPEGSYETGHGCPMRLTTKKPLKFGLSR